MMLLARAKPHASNSDAEYAPLSTSTFQDHARNRLDQSILSDGSDRTIRMVSTLTVMTLHSKSSE